jgi:hypothetical protein
MRPVRIPFRHPPPPGVHSLFVRFSSSNVLILCDLHTTFFQDSLEIGYICTNIGAFARNRAYFVAGCALGTWETTNPTPAGGWPTLLLHFIPQLPNRVTRS